MDATVTVAEAARTLTDLVNRAHLHQETTTLIENGQAVARIIPIEERFKTGKELAALLREDRPRLGPEEAAAFEEDIQAARDTLPAPVVKWD